MDNVKPKLIVALDVDTLEETRKFVDMLSPAVDIFKVGSQLFTSCGPAAVRFILARGKKVFLDLKYHDIPNTVASAVKAAVGLGDLGPGILMLTVHTQGGKEMLESACEAARAVSKEMEVQKSFVLGITVLTSEVKTQNLEQVVLERAELARESGCDGVVASVEETALIRQRFGKDFLIITPGIRPAGVEINDQKRIATPKAAVLAGSNFLVVGRPILTAPDPLSAAKKIIEEIDSIN